jgi:hypothetical protein
MLNNNLYLYICPESELMNVQFRLKFLGITVRGLRLEVSVWISLTTPPFFFTETVRGCVSLKKYKSQAVQ